MATASIHARRTLTIGNELRKTGEWNNSSL